MSSDGKRFPFATGLLLAALAAACGNPQRAQKAPDKYDESKMDFAPAPAKVTAERGAYDPATGPATSMAPAMPVLEPYAGPKERLVKLDATNKAIEIAPGVWYSGWTFGDAIPGPVVRARVGDKVKFVMTNRTDEMIGGVNFGMPMPHSMDFHSAMVSPQDKYRSVVPGETVEFTFTANYPGVYMYHCGTPPILEHIAAGMYGMMVVDPKDGYPGKADREYALVQSEFYLKPDPQKRMIGEHLLQVTDMERAADKRPTHVVFNGRAGGMIEKPLYAKPGERVRLFVLNVGPSDTSSFHVVGTIFDRAYLEGNPDNRLRGMQTVLLGASNGMIAEFRIPEPGKYIMVDHEFADASKGAVGLIDATDGAAPPKPAATAAGPTLSGDAADGALLYKEKMCLSCHNPPSGMPRMAPELIGVTAKRDKDWLKRWIMDPQAMLATDPEAKKLFAEWKGVMMPTVGITDIQATRIIAYLEALDAAEKAKKAPASAPAGSETGSGAGSKGGSYEH